MALYLGVSFIRVLRKSLLPRSTMESWTSYMCMQAQHPPYDLPRKFAEQAQDTFDEILREGLTPNLRHYNILMDCQASCSVQHDDDDVYGTFTVQEGERASQRVHEHAEMY